MCAQCTTYVHIYAVPNIVCSLTDPSATTHYDEVFILFAYLPLSQHADRSVPVKVCLLLVVRDKDDTCIRGEVSCLHSLLESVADGHTRFGMQLHSRTER